MALNKLLQNGVTFQIFDIKRICEIEKSPDQTAQTEVIDFDATKRKLVASFNQGNFGINEPKSCDALKIIPSKKMIDFIEFKGFADFKKHNQLAGTTDPKIRDTIDGFALDEKIAHSIWLFGGLLYISRLGLTKSEVREINSAEKNYLVMVDLKVKENPLLGLAATLNFLSHPAVDDARDIPIDTAIWQVLQDKLDGLDVTVKVNKPILIGADKIDEYYQKLLAEAS